MKTALHKSLEMNATIAEVLDKVIRILQLDSGVAYV